MRVLVPNLGSTSLKFKLLEFPDERELASGRMERIGRPGGDAPSYRAAIEQLLSETGEVDAVSFKAVHAGPKYRGTFRVDDDLLAALEEYRLAAPLHNDIYLEGIREFRSLRPDLELVAVLETGFHASMPDWVKSYGLPAEWRDGLGVQRYGFHGASHRSVAERVPRILRTSPEGLRIVSCHLGGSSSVCAILDGRSLDTSMGFSPQSGIENATRHGELDAFAALFLMDRLGLTAAEMRERLVRDCGLAGLSGIAGGDVRDIEAAAAEGDPQAELALAVFACQVRKAIGAYAAEMGGLDVLVFTGGIGENAAGLRKRICADMDFLGLELSDSRNETAEPDCQVSKTRSYVSCFVLVAHEEQIVGREAYRLLGGE